ncbi:universal stress protein [Streptomyces flaveolus]|uniref:universal stress protein n=1 Tax=Streptomyces flaveolus TaxID=67297 RepID=UPI003F54268C
MTAGMDGSPESLTTADRAAGEALLRGARSRLVHALGRQPYTYAPGGGAPKPSPSQESPGRRADRVLREAAARIARRHPGLRITTDRVPEEPAPALLGAAGEGDLLVLGARGRGRAAGFLVGSPSPERPWPSADGLSSSCGAACVPRTNTGPAPSGRGHTVPPRRPGPRRRPSERHRAGVRLQYRFSGRRGAARRTRPVSGIGKAGSHLVGASRDAPLAVVGRRRRRTPIGPVVHAVLRHATAPVAVVPHGTVKPDRDQTSSDSSSAASRTPVIRSGRIRTA